jgi:hypothetical protein
MPQYEVLSRASAAVVRGPAHGAPLLVTSRHVTFPHHYSSTYYAGASHACVSVSLLRVDANAL